KSPTANVPKTSLATTEQMQPHPQFAFSDTVASLSRRCWGRRWCGAGDVGFQGLNRLLTLIQAGHSIDVEIHTRAGTELIAHRLGVNGGLSTESGMRAPHGLKRSPVESDGFELRCDQPSPRVVPPQGCRGPCGRKDPRIGIG